MSIEERLEAPRQAAPELFSLNMGSMNFNFSDLASKPREWKHDWEKPFFEIHARRDHGCVPAKVPNAT